MDIGHSGAARAVGAQGIAETVVATIAEVTRYPLGVLRLEAELEDELGIESVKRAEILSVLSTRLSLPPPPTDGSLGRLRTIADVVALVETGLSARPASVTPVPSAPVAAVAPASAPSPAPFPAPLPPSPAPVIAFPPPAATVPAGLADTVIATIAEVTRYPLSVLRLDAELEDELGIESVKRAEIVAVLGRKLGVTPPNDGSIGPLRTIGDVVAAVERIAAGGGAPAVAPAAVVARPETAAPAAPAATAPVLPLVTPPAPAAAPVIRAFEALPAPRPAPVALEAPGRRAAPDRALAGKVALVTGSGHGLGKALARHLAHLGASVVVNSFHSPALGGSTVAELSAEGADAIHVWGSVSNPEHLDQIFAAIEARHGHLDFLVHNASDARPVPLAEITAEDWHRAFRADVVGLHQVALRAAALMAPRGGGKIVTLTHPAAQRCFEDSALLGTVKAGVESLTRYLAVELGPRNIQVNSVCAGPLRERIEGAPGADRLIPGWESRSPVRRLPDAGGIASAVAFLLSDAASQMTGATLVVDGGISLST
jgi:NAD(P)-dependent dehydrogenase (short-subunit alcohol dehydrogenase family)/acyl carrier protein